MHISIYRLEACSVCGVIRRGLIHATTHQRMLDRRDRYETIGGAEIWSIDFCESCRTAYNKMCEEQEAGMEDASQEAGRE